MIVPMNPGARALHYLAQGKGAFWANYEWFEDEHDGPGWYWWYGMKDDRPCGAFETLPECVALAEKAGFQVQLKLQHTLSREE